MADAIMPPPPPPTTYAPTVDAFVDMLSIGYQAMVSPPCRTRFVDQFPLTLMDADGAPAVWGSSFALLPRATILTADNNRTAFNDGYSLTVGWPINAANVWKLADDLSAIAQKYLTIAKQQWPTVFDKIRLLGHRDVLGDDDIAWHSAVHSAHGGESQGQLQCHGLQHSAEQCNHLRGA